MKRLFKLRYPKLALLLLVTIIAYYLFSNEAVKALFNTAGTLNYLSAFVFGLLFSFGFTTPLAIGFFVTLETTNPILTALIGGLGALIADLLIFYWIRFTFMDEFKRLSRTSIITRFNHSTKSIPQKIRHYLSFAIAGIIIASPLPDELGVSMLAGLSHIKANLLAIISFIANTIGILILILIGTTL